MLQLNHNIKLIRELSGRKQADFAKLIKTKLSNLKTYENTDVRPKAIVLAAVADFAGITMEDLENKKLTHKDVLNGSKKDKKVPRASFDEMLDRPIPLGELEFTLKDYLEEIRKDKAFLQEFLLNKVKGIDSNLKKTLGAVEKSSLQAESAREVVLGSLSRLERKPQGSLKQEADSIVKRLIKGRKKQDSSAEAGK